MMRKTGTTILVLSLLALFAHGQYDVGVIGGFNAAKIGGEHTGAENTFRLGLLAGATMNLELTDDFDLRTDISFSSKGGINALGEPEQTNTIVNYLDFSPMISYSVNQGPRISFYTGPVVSYLLTAENRFDDDQQNIEPWIRKANMGLAIGGEVEWVEKLSLGIRAQGSLTNLPDNNWEHAYNRVVQIYAKYDIKRFY